MGISAILKPLRGGLLCAIAATGIGIAGTVGAQAQPLEPVPAEIVATYEVGTFLESIAVRADGDMLVVDHTTHNILIIAPDGTTTTLAHLDQGAAGIALDLDGTLIVTSGFQQAGGFVTVLSPTGTVEDTIAVPGSMFLNGAALLSGGVVLVADSIVGHVFRVDVRTGSVSVWLADPLLAPDPDLPLYPGANGIKISGSIAYITNSGLAHMIAVPIERDGTAGMPRVVVTDTILDDIAIAADGTVYGATHPNNSVVRMTPDGSVTTIATADDGLTGATALAFGRTEADANQLYVVTNGGVYLPPETGVVDATVVSLTVDDVGVAPLAGLAPTPHPTRIAPIDAWLVRCDTAPGDTAALRATYGAMYLAYLEAQLDRIRFAGQYYAGEAVEPTARFYTVTASSADAAHRMMWASPYAQAGLYSACEVGRFSGLLGTLLGGVAWPDEASAPVPRPAE